MLFILSGQIQTGKTRWLEALVVELAAAGVEAYGVLAPGVWAEQRSEDGSTNYEKLGIDNMLLPSGRVVPLARRRDLAKAEGSFDEASQSARAQLGWEMSDAAIKEVNAHFMELAHTAIEAESNELQFEKRALLVVDELGPLELVRGEGLSAALSLLEKGPNSCWPHALVVVREALVDLAVERFARSWPCVEVVSPSDETRSKIIRLVNEQAS